MEKYENKIKLLNECGIKSNSVTTYSYLYKRIIEDVFDGSEPKNMLDKSVVEKLLKYVEEDVLMSRKKNFLITWRKIAEISEQKGDMEIINKKIKELNEESLLQPASKKELENKTSINYVIEMREDYKKKLTKSFGVNDIYYLLCSLYSYLPPLRSQDYFDTVIKTENTNLEKDNYYDIEEKEIVLNGYKTVKNHGKRVINVPDELAEIIETFHEKSGSNYLICTRTGKKLESNTFSDTFNRCLKKNASSSMLRKTYISSMIDNGVSAKERKEKAKIMGHTVGTQQLIYSKFSEVLHPKEDEKEIEEEEEEDIEKLSKKLKYHEAEIKRIKEKMKKILDE